MCYQPIEANINITASRPPPEARFLCTKEGISPSNVYGVVCSLPEGRTAPFCLH